MMNRALLNPFESSDIPSHIQDFLQAEHAVCVRFNRHGNLLAIGAITGRIIIWDFDTRVVATVFNPPDDPIPNPFPPASASSSTVSATASTAASANSTAASAKAKQQLKIVALAFAAPGNGSVVMVAYWSGILRVYDTLTTHLISEVIFDVNLHDIAAHPKISNVVVVVPVEHPPLLVHLCRGRYSCRTSFFATITDPSTLVHAPALSTQLPHAHPPPTDDDTTTANNAQNGLEVRRMHTAYANTQLAKLPPPAPHINISLVCACDEFARRGSSGGSSGGGVGCGVGRGGNLMISTELANANTTSKRRFANFAVAFTRRRQRLLRAGPTGILRTFSFQVREPNTCITAHCVATAAIQGRAPVRAIVISRKEMVLVNSYDRCMRLYPLSVIEAPGDGGGGNGGGSGGGGGRGVDGREEEMDEVQLVSRGGADIVLQPFVTFTEVVNKLQCRSACFWLDDDFVLGGMEGAQHRIQVWRVADGQVELSLEGAKEGIVQTLTHPLHPMIVSLGAMTGGVYIWAKEVSENWSAFSTQFSELEANEEYVEKEDEFDVNDEDSEKKQREEREEVERCDVDIVGEDGYGWFSSDSEPESYFYVPAEPKVDCEREDELLSDAIVRRRREEMKARRERGGVANGGVRVAGVGGEGRKRRPNGGGGGRRRGRGKRSRSGRGGGGGNVNVIADVVVIDDVDGGSGGEGNVNGGQRVVEVESDGEGEEVRDSALLVIRRGDSGGTGDERRGDENEVVDVDE